MICTPLALDGACLIETVPHHDNRGSYTATWCAREFRAFGLSDCLVQCGEAHNLTRGTVRGMHMQAAPHAQIKLVRCTRGAIYDVIVDLRPASPTYGRWIATELSADRSAALYVPDGFAHGYQTLDDDTNVSYQMSAFYHSEAERGVRWDDPRVAIAWPIADVVVSARDRAFPDFQP